MLDNNFKTICQSPLFAGILPEQLRAMLGCLPHRLVNIKKNQCLLQESDEMQEIGLLVEGRLHIFHSDFWGNRNIVSDIWPAQLFGETYACLPGSRLDISISAIKPSRIVYFNLQRLITTCARYCPFHARVSRNLLSVMASANLRLQHKLLHVTQRTSREKLLSYLSEQAAEKGSSTFTIPFNRQQLADYLAINRSAMSLQLQQLKEEGLITFNKNDFHLLTPPTP